MSTGPGWLMQCKKKRQEQNEQTFKIWEEIHMSLLMSDITVQVENPKAISDKILDFKENLTRSQDMKLIALLYK